MAGLVAEGLTNREIARRLVISERTARNHVQHILTKLSLATRRDVAAWYRSLNSPWEVLPKPGRPHGHDATNAPLSPASA